MWGRGRGGGVDAVSRTAPAPGLREPRVLFLSFPGVRAGLGAMGDKLPLCLSGNQSPAQINCLTYLALSSFVVTSRVSPADFNPRTYRPAEPEKLGFLQWADYKPFCRKCLGQAVMNWAGEGL